MHSMTSATRLVELALLLLLMIAAIAPTGAVLAGESDPPAYVIVQENIVNAKEFDRYRKAASSTVAEHDGKPIAVARKVQILEGKWVGNQTVVIEFPSLDEAKSWYFSQNYQKAIPIRKGATSFSNIVIVEGLKPGPLAGGGGQSGH